jgi:16S rRNA (cytosine967-C5)-methyltransferase
MYALERGAVSDVEGFAEGAFLVMDPGSAVCALLVGAKPGQRVLDLCAAPGGKTVLLARDVSTAKPHGHVVAVEEDERRAARIHENVARMKLEGRAAVLVADARTANVAPADAVLLDAPCTGLGTTRRKPEIKLRRTPKDLVENAKIQRELLDRALSLTKPGGVLVYSVCSPMPEEGRAHIDGLVSSKNDVVLEDARATLPWLPANAVDDRGCVRLLPHRHDADAFFAARLRRR